MQPVRLTMLLKRLLLLTAIVSFQFTDLGTCSVSGQQSRPNVIHIFADDLGWGAVGFNNPSTYVETPNLDALANAGMRLTRSYASTVCSPSRANLLTGFHNGHAANDRNGNISAGLRGQDVTVGEIMSGAGYRTGVAGKWGWGATGSRDLSGSDPTPSINDAESLPTNQGYSEFYGYLNHAAAHDYYYDHMWQSSGLNSNTTITANNGGPGGSPEYTHDLVHRYSEQFIRDSATDTEPFYLQVNYTIPHFDLDDIGTAPAMVDLDGNQIFASGLAQYATNSSLSTKQKQHAAMISRMDAAVGSLMTRLQDPNGDGNTSDSVLDNTLIIFSSDNGTTPEDGLGSTNASNPLISGGLKGGKRDLYEGGIRMPSFAYWNGTIEAGSSSDILNDLADFQATAADLAGTYARVGTDGVSILPTLIGDAGQRDREFLVFENFENSNMGFQRANWTILRGNLKLIRFNDGSYELYDVVADPGENSPLDLGVAANQAIRDQLETLALEEGAGRPDAYAVEFREWVGSDHGMISESSNWAVTDEPNNSNVGVINETWSARVRNTGTNDATAVVSADVQTLGFEVGGQTHHQKVVVDSGATLSGRNEVRIADKGEIQLNHATVASRRWVDIHAGGKLSGAGTIASNVYNAGTLSPGFESVNVNPPDGGDFFVAIDFSGIDNRANKDAFYTPLTTSIDQATISLDYGASTGSSLNDRGFNDFAGEFNLNNWSTGATLQDAIDDDAFVSVKVTPVSGLTVELLGAGFEFWRNGSNSPTSYGILTNLNGFNSGSALGTATLTTSGANNALRFEVTGTAGLSTDQILDVRLYGWNAPASTGHTHLTAADLDLRFATSTTQSFTPAGVLEIQGSLWHQENAWIAIGLSGLDNSNPDELQFDAIEVLGVATLEGNLSIELQDGFVPQQGDVYTLLTASSITGQFNQIQLLNAEGWDVEMIYGTDFVSARFITAVPEPSAAVGLLLGAVLIGIRRRRNK